MKNISKDNLLEVIEFCTKVIQQDVDNKNRLDAEGSLTPERRNELELKNCGMRNLRNALIEEYCKMI